MGIEIFSSGTKGLDLNLTTSIHVVPRNTIFGAQKQGQVCLSLFYDYCYMSMCLYVCLSFCPSIVSVFQRHWHLWIAGPHSPPLQCPSSCPVFAIASWTPFFRPTLSSCLLFAFGPVLVWTSVACHSLDKSWSYDKPLLDVTISASVAGPSQGSRRAKQELCVRHRKWRELDTSYCQGGLNPGLRNGFLITRLGNSTQFEQTVLILQSPYLL